MSVLRPILNNPYHFSIYFHMFIIIFSTIIFNVQPGLSIKPETVLSNILLRPFEPTKWSTKECQRDSAIYLEELSRYTPWALKMYDASVKIPTGIITGNYKQLGNYNECLQVKSDQGISGQSCSATIQFEVAEDNSTSKELDFADLLVNVATASMHENWSKMLVLNGNMVTDTFFLLSGVLLAYTEVIKKEKSTEWKFDVVGLYLHRYARLTPAYAMMIGFYATIYYKFGSGPHWDTWVGSNQNYCRDNWWTNLLYVNNYVNVADMCMSQSWYLAVDMQLIWLSPIFLYPMLKPMRRIFFWIIIGAAFVLSILLPFAMTFFNRFTATMLYYKEQSDVANVFLYIYTRVYTRAGPYIVGLALGYLLAKRKFDGIKLRKLYVVIGWLVAIVVAISAVFGAREMYFDDHPYNRLEASFYAGMHRHAFALVVSWIIFCCVYGYAGLVGELLSWRGWAPLSRLTYSAYLCHYVFILSRAGSVRTTGNLTSMSVMYTFFGNLSFTMALSLLWSLSFEIPFIILDRTFLSRKKKKTCTSKHDQVNKERYHSSMDFREEVYKTSKHDQVNKEGYYSSMDSREEAYKTSKHDQVNKEEYYSSMDSREEVYKTAKHDQVNKEGYYSSMDSREEVYRTIDDPSWSRAQITSTENAIEIAATSANDYINNKKQKNKSLTLPEGKTENDNCTNDNCVYIINAFEVDKNRNSYVKSDLEEIRTLTERK
ncbi:PREDICTED: nose resistant to fluoxetine protein 6 isoform X3 [Polistes dominula]|uniref:Nose resistant to fluoxetine protein 6 isoform X3 n=1 Tax=Polistes dominula TaxID=743375 RepID=A0ABM1J2N3_POLDO|nr:PREDICTED: nose resistant to fluoxetine protein 6 isoform X3 [Polistes dominula]